MSLIPDETIEQVRDSADLVALIGESVELKRMGADYRGPCPFHGGTHRNFAVIPKKQLYYCYVCHAAGDAFSYFMKRFGMDYPTAVREVARRTGIVIPESTQRAGPDPREPLFTAVSLAQDWFARQLVEAPEAESARKYLAGRGITMETAQPLGLGFAPGGAAFLEAMGKHQLEQRVMLEAGLLHKRDDGRIVPRFRGRLLFPIHDLRGRVVGFGGRILGPGEPKYLNSPESPIFHKGAMLYNLHQAKNAIRKAEQVILVEGYFDVIRLVLAGIEHVVAPLGTALTPDQASLLRRFTSSAVLLYDSDAAGQRATFRAGDELLRRDLRVRVATMPAGEDPDTLARAGGAAAVEQVVKDAVDILERKIQLLETRGWFSDVEHRREALDRLLPTVRAAADPVTRDLYVSLVSRRVGITREVLEREMETTAVRQPSLGSPANARKYQSQVRKTRRALRTVGRGAEEALLRVVTQFDGWLERAGREVPPEWLEELDTAELYRVLLSTGRRQLTIQELEALSPDARELWGRVITPSPSLTEASAMGVYEGALINLEARPRFRDYADLQAEAQISGNMDLLKRATDEWNRLADKYPEFATKYRWGLGKFMAGFRARARGTGQKAASQDAQ